MKKIIELDCPSCGNHWTGFNVDVVKFNGFEFIFYCPLCNKTFRFREYIENDKKN